MPLLLCLAAAPHAAAADEPAPAGAATAEADSGDDGTAASAESARDVGAATDAGAASTPDPTASGDAPTPGKTLGEKIIDSIFLAPIQYRHFYRDNYDLDHGSDDGDNFDWFKLGFGMDLQAHEMVRVKGAARLTRSWGNNVTNSPLHQQDHLDLWEGYIELGSQSDLGIAARAWRQVINLGNQRLVGALDWVNNARTFDGGRVLAKLGDIKLDAFWVREVRYVGPDDTNHNTPSNTDFIGLYAVVPIKPIDLTLEPFYFVKYNDNESARGEDGERAPLHLHSPGVRAVWKLGLDFVLDLYAVLQYGKFGTDTTVAYALSSRIDFNAAEHLWPLHRVRVEWNYGSGDRDPTDRRHNTLDNLYPTNHAFYGEMDLFSWQNTISLQGEIVFELMSFQVRESSGSKKKPGFAERAGEAGIPDQVNALLGVSVWSFWLAERKDSWYSAGGGSLGRDTSGGSGRHVGQEVDAWLKVGPIKFVYSHFFPGGFARDTRGNNGADQFYAEVLLKF
jgi:hypothetical protein